MRASRRNEKQIDTIYWFSIIGFLFSVVYTIVVMTKGAQVIDKIDYIYNRNQREAERKWRMTLK
ncbi:hypothetical protein [Metabacillus endolithicus]|uniref:Uncharacterized protein n=1 Tax=Metabacillus endolithicus TaxID=1535204 RepID=A0ABW5BXK9_9BACI|nr:hypothetical protein [Metabacillus endolithicus]UPG63989.1 hypothetical protein MVE64_02285 [Metabacillus endolithicus]